MNLKQYATGLQHIGIPTLSTKESQTFYEGLGFECIHSKIIKDGTQKVCFMQLGNLVLELYEESKIANVDGAIDHFAINVHDIEEVYSFVKNKGYTMLEKEIQYLPFFDKGVRYFIIEGINKERIEFNQYI